MVIGSGSRVVQTCSTGVKIARGCRSGRSMVSLYYPRVLRVNLGGISGLSIGVNYKGFDKPREDMLCQFYDSSCTTVCAYTELVTIIAEG